MPSLLPLTPPSTLLAFLGILQNQSVPTFFGSSSTTASSFLGIYSAEAHTPNLDLFDAKTSNARISRKAPSTLLWTQQALSGVSPLSLKILTTTLGVFIANQI